MNPFDSLKKIKENNNEKDVEIICKTLIKLINNILIDPRDDKSRTIKLESKDISDILITFDGGMEALFEIGFEEVENQIEFI
jgi:hypothetical protein